MLGDRHPTAPGEHAATHSGLTGAFLLPAVFFGVAGLSLRSPGRTRAVRGFARSAPATQAYRKRECLTGLPTLDRRAGRRRPNLPAPAPATLPADRPGGCRRRWSRRRPRFRCASTAAAPRGRDGRRGSTSWQLCETSEQRNRSPRWARSSEKCRSMKAGAVHEWLKDRSGRIAPSA